MVLGIDFGTTNSCISIYQNDNPHVFINPQGKYTTPTALYFDPDTQDVFYGSIATQFKSNVITNFKRLIGIKFTEYKANKGLVDFFKYKTMEIVETTDGFCGILVNGECYSIIDLVSVFLKKFIDECVTNQNSSEIVITVPAYHNDIQRQHLKLACENIDLQVIRIINEPTAAALAYAFKLGGGDKTVLVIDSGGGTTDLSILNLDNDSMVFNVLRTYGDNFCGGEDLTELVYKWAIKIVRDQLTTKQRYRLKRECERAKCALQYAPGVDLTIDAFYGDRDYNNHLTRARYHDLVRNWFRNIESQIVTLVGSTMIDTVVFVGGTTKSPQFLEICERLFPKAHICSYINPDQTVSIGAAIQGALLSGTIQDPDKRDALLIDIIPLSMGIETAGGLFCPLITRNTEIPFTVEHTFTNDRSYIDSIDIDIYQGERRFVDDNYHLGTFTLVGLDDRKKRGDMHIKVKFHIDHNSILHVSAHDLDSDKKANITIDQFFRNESSSAEAVKNILEYSENQKIEDSIRASKLQRKIDLHEKFMYYLGVFRERIDELTQFPKTQLNTLFNKVFDVITNYQDYSPERLDQIIEAFGNDWHKFMFTTSSLLVDNTNGDLIEGGATQI